MTLDAWLRDRSGWLVSPAVVGNTLVVGVAAPYAISVLSLPTDTLSLVLLLTASITAALQVVITALALGGLKTFRDLAAGRVALTPEHRLVALGEVRRLPGRLALLGLVGWVGGALLLGVAVVLLTHAPWGVAARLTFMGAVFGSMSTVMVSLLLTMRAHQAADRLADGLPPHDVVRASPVIAWSVRNRVVMFTVLLTVVPAVMLVDVVRAVTLETSLHLAALAPDARAAAIDEALASLVLRLLLLGALTLVFASVAAFAGGSTIAGPMQTLAAEAERLARGGLERSRVIAADGEVWRVTGVFAQLHERLAGLVGKILSVGTSVRGATRSLEDTSARSEATAAEQAAALNQTSATTEELAQSARQIAASAASVQDLARRTLEAAEQGQADAAAFQAAVDRMKQDNRSIAGAVERLQRRVQQIGRIIELINTVADRSDLLALSAELEGTRAGEVGRGFSLVGAEMRRLAENVLESTAEVEELIAEIRDATLRTAEATSRGSSLTEHGTSLADGVTLALGRVAEVAQLTSNQVRTITLGTQQQQSSTDQLAEAMSEILAGTQQELVTTQRLADVNHRLLGLSHALQGVVSRFGDAKGPG